MYLYMSILNLEVSGSGEKAILFLHGWGGNKDSFNNITNILKYNFKIVKIDLFGFGKSLFPENISDIYDYALKLFIEIEKYNLKEIIIVAHSFGGRLALILASFFDLKINKLILIGCAGIKPRKTLKTMLKIKTYKILKAINNRVFFHIDLSRFGSSDYKNVTNNMRDFFIKVVNEDLRWLLKNIKTKTEIFVGKNDNSTPIYMARILNNNIKFSNLIILKNTGHFCFLDYPYQIIEKIL